MPRLLLVALLFMGLAVGCASSAEGGGSGAPKRPTTDATLQISTPAANETTGPHVDVVMTLEHAHLVPFTQYSGRIRPDQGHIHVLVDGSLIAMPTRLTEQLPILSAGPHTVQAEFVASDHLQFANRVVAAVTFNVR